MSLLELLNELMAVDVVGRETVLCCHQAQGGGKMGLTHTRRPEEYHVLPILQEAHSGQLVNLALVYGGLEGAGQKVLCKSRQAAVKKRGANQG